MSIEKNIERIANALEALVDYYANFNIKDEEIECKEQKVEHDDDEVVSEKEMEVPPCIEKKNEKIIVNKTGTYRVHADVHLAETMSRDEVKKTLDGYKVKYNGKANTKVLRGILERILGEKAIIESISKPEVKKVDATPKLDKEIKEVKAPKPLKEVPKPLKEVPKETELPKKEVTIEQARDLLKAFAMKHDEDIARNILGEFKAKKISEIDKKYLPAFVERIALETKKMEEGAGMFE